MEPKPSGQSSQQQPQVNKRFVNEDYGIIGINQSQQSTLTPSYYPKRNFKDDDYADSPEIGSSHSIRRGANTQRVGTSGGGSAIGLGFGPSHRSSKRPVSILKNKKNQVGRFRSTHFWDYGHGESSNSDAPGQQHSATITDTNFFECREVTNCEFIYEQSDKTSNRVGFMSTIGRLFSRTNAVVEITAMCAVKDLLAIGFSNGVLILFDVEKLEIVFSHKHFTKNDNPIDKLKLFQYENRNKDEQLALLLSLSDGLLTYHHFPKISLIDELIIENNIVDFQAYQISRRPFLSTIHKSRELKIFRLRKRLEYSYMTKISLDQVPLAFLVQRDIFLVTYKSHAEYIRIENKGKEQESIIRLNLWQNNEPDSKYNPLPVFDESIQAFVVTKEDYSFYMDLRGVYDREFNKIKWSDHVMNVEIVRPYLVGFLPNSIEIKNIFNPNRVVQKVELLHSSICQYTVAMNHINLRELDSMYLLLNRKASNIKVLLKMTQIDPRVQINMLIERKLYSTGLKFCDLLLENNFEGLTREQYDKLQREKGFYNFIVKRRYYIAKEIFKEFKVPLQLVILLFSEIYPRIYIQRLIEMFEINLKEIPYFDLQKQKEMGIFEYQYKSNSNLGLKAPFISINQSEQHNVFLKNELDEDKLLAIKEFLTYFLKNRSEITKKIEKISLVEKSGDPYYTADRIGSGSPQENQAQNLSSGPHIIGGRPRKGSMEGNKQDSNMNPFDLPIIPDNNRRYHQSDNDNMSAKLSQLLYLRIMTEIFLFHSLILLIRNEEEKDKIILRNEFFQLIKNNNALPADFCLDVFFKYSMYDEALLFLFYRKEYKELLNLIQREFEKNSTEKDQQKYWIHKFVKFCKKINELVSEDFIITHTEWVFKIDRDLGLECLKKLSKEDPLKSDKILRHIKENGGPKACIKYLEFLTLECGIAERPIHTELACLYVQYINSILHKNYLLEEGKDSEGTPLYRIDVEQADNDENIFLLRKKLLHFFENSDYFEPALILELMPPDYLFKEKVILLAKSRKYKEAFAICVENLNDAEYAITVAHRAFKWYKDKSIYFHLFVKLLSVGEREEAMRVLKSNFQFISYDKVTKYLPDDEQFDGHLNEYYKRAFVDMEKFSKQLKILKNLTQSEYINRVEELLEAKNNNFTLKEESLCSRCQKRISNFPFYYIPKTQEMIHYYCFAGETAQYGAAISPEKMLRKDVKAN